MAQRPGFPTGGTPRLNAGFDLTGGAGGLYAWRAFAPEAVAVEFGMAQESNRDNKIPKRQ